MSEESCCSQASPWRFTMARAVSCVNGSADARIEGRPAPDESGEADGDGRRASFMDRAVGTSATGLSQAETSCAPAALERCYVGRESHLPDDVPESPGLWQSPSLTN